MPKGFDAGDTAFVLISAALVMLMTPGLAFFYGGLVGRKNVLAIMMQSYASMAVTTIVWCSSCYAFSSACVRSQAEKERELSARRTARIGESFIEFFTRG